MSKITFRIRSAYEKLTCIVFMPMFYITICLKREGNNIYLVVRAWGLGDSSVENVNWSTKRVFFLHLFENDGADWLLWVRDVYSVIDWKICIHSNVRMAMVQAIWVRLNRSVTRDTDDIHHWHQVCWILRVIYSHTSSGCKYVSQIQAIIRNFKKWWKIVNIFDTFEHKFVYNTWPPLT